MAKTSSTVHLENSTWEEIDKYRKQYGCGRNEAIERMFVERRILINLGNKQLSGIEENKKEEISADIVEDKEMIDIALDAVYSDMK